MAEKPGGGEQGGTTEAAAADAAAAADTSAAVGWPLHAYRRLPAAKGAGLFAEDDAISSAALRETTLVLGTRRGRVLALQHYLDNAPIELGRHDGCVTDVSLDTLGRAVASSAADGSVAVSCLPTPSSSSRASARTTPDSSAAALPSDESPDEAGASSSAFRRWVYTYAKPVFSVAICPDYSRNTIRTRCVCVGGEEGKLILNRRGAFDSKNFTVHLGEGRISCIRWRGSLIAWANARGVKVVDIETYQKVTHIPWPSSPLDARIPADACCCLAWPADDSLLIGKDCFVLTAELKEAKELGSAGSGVRFGKVTHCFGLQGQGASVQGLCAFDEEHLSVLLSCGSREVPSAAGEEQAAAAHVVVSSLSGEVCCHQRLPGFASVGLSGRASLLSAGREHGAPTLVVFPQDLLAVERRTVKEQTASLVESAQFEAALTLVSHASPDDAQAQCRICLQSVRQLLGNRDAARAARLVRQLSAALSKAGAAGSECAASVWQELVSVFDGAEALPLLVAEIPLPQPPPKAMKGRKAVRDRGAAQELPADIYDSVLKRLAAISPAALCEALDRWPSSVYSAGPLMESLMRALPASLLDSCEGDGAGRNGLQDAVTLPAEQLRLARALAALHEAQAQQVKAARLLARVDSDAFFAFVARHIATDEALQEDVATDPARLLEMDHNKALVLFVSHPAAFQPALVIQAVRKQGGKWAHRYMRLLHEAQPEAAQPLWREYVESVAKFEPQVLGVLVERWVAKARSEHKFLDDSGDDEANPDTGLVARRLEEEERVLLEVCRSVGAPEGEAMLLARNGHLKEAVELLLYRLGDVQGVFRLLGASEHAAGYDSVADIWDIVLAHCSRDSRTYSLLLAQIAGEPGHPLACTKTLLQLVSRLPPDLEIPRLSTKMLRVLQEAEAEAEVQQAARDLLQSRVVATSAKVFKEQRRGRSQKAIAVEHRPVHARPKTLAGVLAPAAAAAAVTRAATLSREGASWATSKVEEQVAYAKRLASQFKDAELLRSK
eukprot:TRINITY_DN44902_c0_g1_i1.p1 TRINITY_DN44902_c0_g1~~TRINITY_DN44902_c0_g1_i1.p1  ORF type:complete len:1011 (+),score=235.68 TRINITY_DN44902_c0_g1_i1:158-3190(+)